MSRSKNDTYVCGVCARGFGRKDDLTVHLIEYDPDKVSQRMARTV